MNCTESVLLNSPDTYQTETGSPPCAVPGEPSNFNRLIQEFARQQANFEVVMACMTQGVALYDAEAKLVFCNRRYMEIYGLSEELAVPGLPFSKMLQYRVDFGSYPDVPPQQYISEKLAVVKSGTPHKKVQRLRNGHTISNGYVPLEGGGWISTHEDVSEIYTLQHEIRHMAYHDQLTGLPNRRMLAKRLASANETCAQNDGFALLFLDLDGFKPVNDTFGHSAGDKLLRSVSERLSGCIRSGDMLARLGGDEFAIVQGSAARVADAEALAERILQILSAPFDIDGQAARIGTSIGIIFSDRRVPDSDTLLIKADQAMYRAKRQGGTRFHVDLSPETDQTPR